MSVSTPSAESGLEGYCKRHFRSLAAGILVFSLAVQLALLFIIAAFRPEIFARTIIGYIVQNVSNPQWHVDFAYPPLTYILYRALSIITTDPILLRLPTIASDLLGGVILVRIAASNLSRVRSLLVLFLYTCNPLLIWLNVTGGFDAIAILMMLLAVVFLLGRRVLPASLFLALGFNLKWFPILLFPLFLKYAQKMSIWRRSAVYLLPALVIFLVSFLALPLFTATGIMQASSIGTNYYSQKGPTGFTIWYLPGLLGLNLQNSILTTLAYLSQLIIFAWVAFRYSANTVNALTRFSLLLLFPVVNLSIQLYPYYFLWFSPFLLLLILLQLPRRRLVEVILLTALTYLLPNLYVLIHFWPNFSDQPWPAPTNTLSDLGLFLCGQAASWLLLVLVVKWTKS